MMFEVEMGGLIASMIQEHYGPEMVEVEVEVTEGALSWLPSCVSVTKAASDDLCLVFWLDRVMHAWRAKLTAKFTKITLLTCKFSHFMSQIGILFDILAALFTNLIDSESSKF